VACNFLYLPGDSGTSQSEDPCKRPENWAAPPCVRAWSSMLQVPPCLYGTNWIGLPLMIQSAEGLLNCSI
jgi:hypothetical protein